MPSKGSCKISLQKKKNPKKVGLSKRIVTFFRGRDTKMLGRRWQTQNHLIGCVKMDCGRFQRQRHRSYLNKNIISFRLVI